MYSIYWHVLLTGQTGHVATPLLGLRENVEWACQRLNEQFPDMLHWVELA